MYSFQHIFAMLTRSANAFEKVHEFLEHLLARSLYRVFRKKVRFVSTCVFLEQS